MLGNIVNVLRQNPFQAVKRLPAALNLDINEKIIRRNLKSRCNINHHKAASKVRLLGPDTIARLQYANEHIDRTAVMWQRSRVGVWRPPRERYARAYVLPSVNSGRITKSYWGHRPGKFVEIERRLNAIQYVDILQNHLLPQAIARYLQDEVIYIVEDNSAVHQSRLVRAWYEAHPRFHRLNHSARSPDLNIIENVWSKMVQEWTPNHAHDLLQIQQRVRESWDSLQDQQQYFEILTHSMRARLQKIQDYTIHEDIGNNYCEHILNIQGKN
ncbi:hypothetical protein TSAR_003950 [Trichomalopsis sarcophagae]|uniref:Tc1-like transposase DDE domain-containing protein n=1 Tax=Trichomalopsis sarcophagae TaxID=543379 RepID=A0A232EG17_9HYME|nr:hypothetical protein TSAR_003950 [Trichomalopsis sarcophagae]